MEDDFFGTLEYVRVKNNRNQTSPIIFSDFHQSLEVLINAISNYDIVSQQTITSFVESNTISKSKDKLLGDALKYFYSEIKILCEQEEKPGEKILEIRNATIGMTIVSIVSTSEEDAYTIFEILNARGQKLEDYELLKNYIMRYIQPIENRDSAKSRWEEMELKLGKYIKQFISHYARHRFGKNQGDTDSDYRNIHRNTKGTDINVLLNDIKLKSEYYVK